MKINFSKNNTHQKNEKRYSKYGPAKRYIAKWQWYAVVLILISPLLFISYRIISSSIDKTFPGFVDFDTVKIISNEDCYISNMDIEIGTRVKKGELIVSCSSKELYEKLLYLKKELKFLTKQNSLTAHNNNNIYKKFIQQSKEYLKVTDNFKNTTSNLRQRGLGTIYQVHGAVMDDFNILMTKELLQYNRFYYETEMTRLGEQILEKKSEIASAEQQIKAFRIKTPVSGEVVKINAYVGQNIPKNTVVAYIADYKTIYVKAYMPPDVLNDDGPLQSRKVEIFFGRHSSDFKCSGTVIGTPYASNSDSKIIQDQEKSTMLYIRIDDEVPERFYSLNYPVKVKIKNG